jgi:hypothetical protein
VWRDRRRRSAEDADRIWNQCATVIRPIYREVTGWGSGKRGSARKRLPGKFFRRHSNPETVQRLTWHPSSTPRRAQRTQSCQSTARPGRSLPPSSSLLLQARHGCDGAATSPVASADIAQHYPNRVFGTGDDTPTPRDHPDDPTQGRHDPRDNRGPVNVAPIGTDWHDGRGENAPRLLQP